MKILVTLNIIIISVLVFLVYGFYSSTRKIVYINTGDVFNSFQMTKEMDKDVKTFEERKQNAIDSLADNIKKVQAGIIKLSEKDFEYAKRDFLTKRSQYAEDISKLKQSSMEKIWKQINQYVTDYGKENKVDIILGANGQGNLMYAKEQIDISKEIISYINKKYAEGN